MSVIFLTYLISPSICPSIFLSVFVSVHVSISLSLYLSISRSDLSIYLSSYLSTDVPPHLPTCLPACPPAYLPPMSIHNVYVYRSAHNCYIIQTHKSVDMHVYMCMVVCTFLKCVRICVNLFCADYASIDPPSTDKTPRRPLQPERPGRPTSTTTTATRKKQEIMRHPGDHMKTPRDYHHRDTTSRPRRTARRPTGDHWKTARKTAGDHQDTAANMLAPMPWRDPQA